MASVAIIGGGISGLSAAHFLAKLTSTAQIRKIVVLEARSQVGGWMRSTQLPDGSHFEQGPRTIRPAANSEPKQTKIWQVRILFQAEDVGLSQQIVSLPKSHPAARNRLLYVNEELHRLPNSFKDVLTVKKPFSKPLASCLLRELTKSKCGTDDESVYSFVSRRFGDEIAKYLVDALCLGIYAGDSRQLSVRSCFGLLHQLEHEHGSVVKGLLLSGLKSKSTAASNTLVDRAKTDNWAVWTLRQGLQQLPLTVELNLRQDPRVEVCASTTVDQVVFADKRVHIAYGDKHVQEFDHVVSAVYAPHLARILPDEQDELKAVLQSIAAVTVAVINLEFPGTLVQTPAFGHLVPSCENSPLLGVIYDSCMNVHQLDTTAQTTRLTCMMGGAHFHKFFGDPLKVDPQQLLKTALHTLGKHMGISAEPLRHQVHVHQDCIPQYVVGHYRKLDSLTALTAQLPLSLVGSSYDGVSINDCVHHGRLAAEKLARKYTTL